MGIHVPHVLAAVRVDDILFVDRQLLVGIDGHKDNALEEINTQIHYKASLELRLQALQGLPELIFFKYKAWGKEMKKEWERLLVLISASPSKCCALIARE